MRHQLEDEGLLGVATEFKLPELAENVTSATVTQVLVKVGDLVARDQPVIEIETEKAAAEVPSTVSGTVTAVRVSEGATVKPGDVLLVVDEKASPVPAAQTAPAKAEPIAKPAAPRVVPTVPAPQETALREVRPIAAPSKSVSPKEAEFIPAAPSVRRLARELGVDLHALVGTGPDGRVLEKDVRTAASRRTDKPIARVAEPEAAASDGDERQPMNNIRRRTAEHMAAAWSTIPHVTHFDKADITEFDKVRKQAGARVEAAGGKLTITAVLIKVLTTALKKFPQFNASVDMAQAEIIYKKSYNIGVAVDTDRGLLVPVIHHADRKTITEIAVALTQMAERARNRKLTLDEMQGGTFTLTNLGGIGGTGFTPIINAPEAAILGVARARVEPVFTDGRFEPRTLLPLALSYDHRVIDGADAARFLRFVVEAMEQPLLLLLEE